MTNKQKFFTAAGAIAIVVALIIGGFLMLFGIPGSASFDRSMKSFQTEFNTENVYREMEVVGRAGETIYETEGRFDVEFRDNRLRWIDEEGNVHLIYLGDSATVLVNEVNNE